jgi:Rha family phage regulatory protein
METGIVFVSDLDNDILVSSRMIAEKFEKEHRNVLASIRELVAQLDADDTNGSDFGLLKIQQSSYLNEQGKRMPEFKLNRDAFSILAMGFTGQKALKWKVLFLRAFDEALGSVSKLREELARKEDVILRLQGKKEKRERRWLVPSNEPTLDGFPPSTVMRPRAERDLSPEQLRQAKTTHVVKTLNGIVKNHIMPAKNEEKIEMVLALLRELMLK